MRIEVRVIPNAKKERIQNLGDKLKIYLTVPALEGKANKRLIEVLADYYNTKKYNIQILRGKESREKIIEISETN